MPNKIWFGKNVKYDHLRVFGYKAFVHVPKDERSKLDAKSRQCIFISYGENEFGYRFYDPLEKKLVKSCDVKFMEDQTIEDIDKVKYTPKEDNGVADFEPVEPPIHGDATEPPQVQLMRSNMERQLSRRYSTNEYVILTDNGEPKCFKEAMESEEKRK